MPTHPIISIIVPNYNHSYFLKQRLDSVFQQTHQDFEVILLDDASTDNSVAILKAYQVKYPDKVSSLNINEQNSGNPFKQWRKGIELAKGEYIWIAESDDIADITFLEKLYHILSFNDKLNIAASNIVTIDHEGGILMYRDNQLSSELYYPDVINHKFCHGNLIVNASSALFRKAAVKQVDWPIIETFRYTGDWLFWCMLLKNSGVGFHNDTLCFHRSHENNVSTGANKQGLFFSEGLKVYNWIKHHVPISNESFIYKKWKQKLNASEFEKNLHKQLLKQLRISFPKWMIYDIVNGLRKQKANLRHRLLLQQRRPFA